MFISLPTQTVVLQRLFWCFVLGFIRHLFRRKNVSICASELGRNIFFFSFQKAAFPNFENTKKIIPKILFGPEILIRIFESDATACRGIFKPVDIYFSLSLSLSLLQNKNKTKNSIRAKALGTYLGSEV